MTTLLTASLKRVCFVVISISLTAMSLHPLVAKAEVAVTGYGYAITMGGAGSDVIFSVALDSEENIFSTGLFTGTVDFDPGAGTDEKTSAGGSDIFLTKINADGTYGWTKTMGGVSTDEARSTAVDSSNNIYIVGRFSSTVDFDPGAGTDEKTSAGGSDIFLTKINADGTYGNTKIVGGTNIDYAHGVAVDADDNVYLTGSFNDTVDFDPGAGTDNFVANESLDMYITKINADGTYGWTKAIGADENDYGYALAVDELDAIYIAGRFGGTVDFDPSGATDDHVSVGSSDIFLTKINADGTYGYTKTMGSTGADFANGIAVSQNGAIYVTGQFTNTVDFDPGVGTDNKISAGSTDVFLAKTNADGTYGWTKTIGGTGSDVGRTVTTDTANNTYLAGSFSGTVDFDPGADTDNKIAAGSTDIFLTRINSDATYGYTKTIGSTTNDESYTAKVSATANVYIAGSFSGTVDFDPTPATDNKTSAGSSDAFLTKLTQTTYQQITGLDPALSATTLSATDATDNTLVNGTTTMIRLLLSDSTPIADVNTTFENDLDWSGVTADSDPINGKSYAHNLTAADGTAGTFTLYVPMLVGDDRVGVCPGASSLTATTDQCDGLYYLIEGEDDNLTAVTIEGQDYWVITGLTGTGGFSAEALATTTTDTGTADTDALAETGESRYAGFVGTVILTITGLLVLAKRRYARY